MNTTYDKIKQWIKRYGPGEVRGTLGAMAGGYLGLYFSHNDVVIGYAGARGENVGYYGYFVWSEYREQRYLYRKKVSFLSLAKGILSEFGAGEILDTAIIRPFTMGLGAKMGGARGLLAGKIAADIIFYISATLLYYRKTKRNVATRIQDLITKIEALKASDMQLEK